MVFHYCRYRIAIFTLFSLRGSAGRVLLGICFSSNCKQNNESINHFYFIVRISITFHRHLRICYILHFFPRKVYEAVVATEFIQFFSQCRTWTM